MTPSDDHPSPGPPPRFRIRGLDGLRALAVALVVVAHLFDGAMPGGFLGVDVFFVISGALITTLLLRERAEHGRIRLGAFWRRRARRLLPALALVVLGACAAAWALGGDVLVGLWRQVAGAASFSLNWLLVAEGGDYFDDTAPELLRNLWSLAVEEQFYLLWPLAVLLIVRLSRAVRIALVAALLAASSTAAWLLADTGARVYYGTDTHAGGLLAGALVALLAERMPETQLGLSRWQRRTAPWLGLLAVAGVVALAVVLPDDEAAAARGGILAAVVLSALAVWALMLPGSMLGTLLERRPLRWVGERSYGLYLWHWPAVVLLAQAVPDWGPGGDWPWLRGVAALAITVLAAALSYRLAEMPVRRLGFRGALRAMGGRMRGSRRALAAGIAVIALLAGAGTASGLALAADPGVGETQAQIEAGESAIRDGDASPAPGPEAPDADRVEPYRGEQIVAIGDSVTVAAADELQRRLPGILVEAAVSRQMREAPDLVRALRDAGRLREVLVLALGTNGSIGADTLERVRELIGPERVLVVVNVQAPRGWTEGVNRTLESFAARYRNVELANWHSSAQRILGELNSDRIHFGPAGARAWTKTVRQALLRLAALPPLRDERDDAGTPIPR
ncbi:acyltransferase family protein [Homoserinibacter sp. YIM 151385]|uniref:acyltransferase family protein n=1 Tax=Homoserinibacter sp. YIM 151385 TaxID=2985506 RepID=UPI0022EFE02B|nr:acyltransferase family protein [Homoserinibacter sp. YIM 151385]WBU37706.1 acyltransferase family protein [Homoserinibacter sp. YIM 151385]